MIKAHPSEALLYQYSSGELSCAMSLLVATHIDMCPSCKRVSAEIEQHLCEKHFDEIAAKWDQKQCDDMLAAIFSSESSHPLIHNDPNNMICLQGRRFNLPPTLANNAYRIGDWNHMLGKLWRAPVSIGGVENTNLIYMEPGATVPEHTHKGVEATLVVNGTFSDEYDSYEDGDFIMLDASRKHSPRTVQEDCLTLATLDAPLHFTSGISRLLNPFSSLFFK